MSAARVLVWLGVVAAVVGAVFLAVGAVERWTGGLREEGRAAGDAAGAARVQALWDEDRAQAQAEALAAAAAAAKETQRRLERQQENQRAQDALLARARADGAGAAAAADGLRLRAATYLDAAGCGALSGDPAVECVRQAAAAIGDALGRSAEIARRAAADADEARARGLKCEADYDALTLTLTVSPP